MGLKDAVKRRTHKERSQPSARKQYGLLEKKKDYLLRAKDYHKKQNALTVLRHKAEERNPDEFYFSMQNTKTKDGVHITRTTEANKYTRDQLIGMKAQDANFVNSKAQSEARKVDRLQQSLHLIGAPTGKRQHTVFVDSETEAETFDPAAHFDTPAELLGRSYNRPRNAQLAAANLVSAGPIADKLVVKAEKRKTAAYKELIQRSERQKALADMAQKMEYDKLVMGNGRKRKLKQEEMAAEGGGAQQQQKVFRWKTQRKR